MEICALTCTSNTISLDDEIRNAFINCREMKVGFSFGIYLMQSKFFLLFEVIPNKTLIIALCSLGR